MRIVKQAGSDSHHRSARRASKVRQTAGASSFPFPQWGKKAPWAGGRGLPVLPNMRLIALAGLLALVGCSEDDAASSVDTNANVAGNGGEASDPNPGGGGNSEPVTQPEPTQPEGTGGDAQSGSGGEMTGEGDGGRSGGAAGASSATGGMSGDPSTPAQSGTGLCGAAEGQLFDSSHPWNQRVDQAALDAESDAIIAYLQANHTSGQRFRIDGPSDEPDSLYGITVLTADDDTTHSDFSETDDFYSPDCDHVPVPLPQGGAIEGEAAYACDGDGDCHLIVVDTEECRLFEMWRANSSGNDFEGGCLAVWDLTAPYEETLRGDCCTSADAAGLPIAAHMFNADEVGNGIIPHAIRFILPNELMRERIYVRPATHSTGATSGPDDAPPYGARLRLRADVDISGLNDAAQVVAQALKDYGMILSDGGNLTFTATNDRFTETKWADVGLGPSDLTSLDWADFEVVDGGERFTWDDSCNCSRTPLTQ